MSDINGIPMLASDVALETAISVEQASMLACQRDGNIDGCRDAQEELVRLIGQRAPEHVMRMEQRKGLRK